MFSGGVSSMSVKKTNASPREDFILPRTCRILLFTCSSPQVEVLIFMADSNHSNTHPTPPHPPLSLAGIFITICHMMCNDWGAMGVVGVFLLVVVAVDHPLWIWCSESIFVIILSVFRAFLNIFSSPSSVKEEKVNLARKCSCLQTFANTSQEAQKINCKKNTNKKSKGVQCITWGDQLPSIKFLLLCTIVY